MSEIKLIENSWLFYVGRFLYWLLFKIIWRCRVYGEDNIPNEGGVIIAPNHVSYADPPLTGSSMKRPLYFMAKQELFEMPVLGFLIRRTHAFPVKRGAGDIGAFKTGLRQLQKGHALLMFPEGTRSRDGNFGKARAGVGMLSCHANVPVVPVRLYNSNKLASLKQINVVFGKPIYPPKDFDKDAYLRFSEQVLEEIKKL
jgi:1-acyl-sn-glycerol-3-phosphate acyltransferase